MTLGESGLPARWSTRLVILLLLLCGFYGSYRAVHLAITNDEGGLLTYVNRVSYPRLVCGMPAANSTGEEWNDPGNYLHFLVALLAKPCMDVLPINEITAGRLPSLLGLALFLWGVWRIGLEFPSGVTRVLITLALLSNAFLLDFFSLARGYGLAVGFTVLSLSFLMQASMSKSPGNKSTQRRAYAALWLASGAVLSNLGFIYFYTAVLAVVIWLCWGKLRKFKWWVNALLLAGWFAHRFVVGFNRNLHYAASASQYSDTGFIKGTVCSLVWTAFYDRRVSAATVGRVADGLVLIVLLLTFWSYRERIRAGIALAALGVIMAVLSTVNYELWGVYYPVERHALYFVPVLILIIGLGAAWARSKWMRVCLSAVLLVISGIGLQGLNLGHTFAWRECADIPSVLLALREIHEQTGQDVMVAISGSKWTVWYYAEHLLGLHPEPSERDLAYRKTYGWLTIYEWRPIQSNWGLPPDNPLLPGTTHLLLNPLNRDDERLLTTPLPGGLARMNVYPDSGTTLEMLIVPQHQGAVTSPTGQKYVGEFKHGVANGQGTCTWPDGQKYVGEFKDGKSNGQGTGTWPDGRAFVGKYKDGVANGQGTYTWPDGQKYLGEFKDGKPNGQGIGTWPDGETYAGEFRDGKPNGQGTVAWPGGRKYVGAFKDGKPNGQGTATWAAGRKYVGEFKDGMPNGQGTATRADGSRYVGEFKDGAPDGQGAATSPDGQKYVGEFKDGKPNGQGTLTWLDGRKYVGEFREGQMGGVGKMTYPDGRVEDGLWKQGQFAGTAFH